MKLNIKRLQEGGGMPFVTYRPAPSMTSPDTSSAETNSTKSSKTSDKGSDNSLLSKSVIEELIKKGLPNDVNQFLKELQVAEKSSLMGMESGVEGIDRNKLYSLAAKANQLIHNSNLMESATKQAYDNDGLEELAVSTTGSLFVQDKNGKISKLSMSEYNKKRDSVYAMTVNDLSKARMYNPNLAFDTEVISTIQNSMGINKINDYMLGILNKLGTETLSKEGYVDKQKLKETIGAMTNGKNPTESELKGIQELASTYQSMGKDGIYKITQEKSTQRNHISDGFEYLWAMLPNNARNVLKARYVVDGNESSNPANIIRNSFYMFTNESSKNTLDYPTSMNKEVNGSEESGKKVFQAPLEKLINGSLDIINDFTLSNPDVSKVGLNLKGSTMNQLPTVKGNMLSSTTLDNVLASGLGAASTKKGIYFGDKLIEDYNFQNVIYDGGQVINTMVPVDRNGKPNLELLENYSNALNEISEKNITNPMQKNQILESYGLDMIKYDADGSLSPISKNYLKPFVVMHGYTTDESKLVDNNKFSIKYKGDEGENYEKLIENLYTSLKLTPPSFGWTSGNSVHKAPIFIPLSPSAQTDVSHFTGHGSLVNANTLQQNLIRQDNSNNSVYAGADLLNYE